jgi:putative membrane protein
MLLWTTPRGRATSGWRRVSPWSPGPLAANQGLDNLFLVAGLLWGLVASASMHTPVLVFFLSCVIVAGVFGAATVSRGILLVQAFPAALALAAVILAR